MIDNGTETQVIECPKCKASMKLRARRSDGAKFYGCSTFPRCKGSKPYRPPAEEYAARDWNGFIPSDYQQAVKDALNSTGNYIIEAGPGSGKTTLLEWLVQFVDTNTAPDVAFWAFNKKIVKELRKRLSGTSFSIATTHSAGRSNAADALGKVTIVTRKMYNMLRDYGEVAQTKAEAKLVDENSSSVTKLVSMLKATLLEPTDENLDHICDRWHVETNGGKDEMYNATRWLYTKSIELAMGGILDFDDMIYLCASGRVPCKKYDLIFVDETQDLNAAQIAMLLNSVKAGGRVFVVGDAFQSVYGFRGADTEAMANVQKALNATALPLSVTYRCPTSHVDYVNGQFPDATILAAPNAKEGRIGSVNDYQFEQMAQPGDLVLCRCNAPLVGPAFRLLRRGVKAVILGKDIGSNLRSLIYKTKKSAGVYSLGDTLEALAIYQEREVGKLMRMKKIMWAETLKDKVETIFALADGCETIRELEAKITKIFAEDAEGVTFSSIHKAKGGEAERVFILKPDLLPHPLATSEWEIKQEKNIEFVAITRSKNELFFVDSEAR